MKRKGCSKAGLDNVTADLVVVRVRGWISKVVDRSKWRGAVHAKFTKGWNTNEEG